MGEGIIAIVQFAMFTLLTTVAASIAVTIAGYLYAAVIEQTAKVDELRVSIAKYSRLASGFQERLDRRKNEAAGSATSLFSAQRQEKHLRARIRELETAGHKFVRFLGEERAPSRQFEILALNTSVSHQVKRGEKHPFYDSSWARPLPIHIWASTMDEAKERFEQVYPKTVGFKLVAIHPAQSDSASRFLPGGGEEPAVDGGIEETAAAAAPAGRGP